MDLLLASHSAVGVRHGKAKVALAFRLLIFASASANVASQRALSDLLLDQLLILFVLLDVLLEELAQIRVQLVVPVLSGVGLALLSSRLGSVEQPIARCLLVSRIGSVTALVDARAFLHDRLLIQHGLRALRAQAHGREALILLRGAQLLRSKLVVGLAEVAEVEATANVALVLILIVLRLASAARHLIQMQWIDALAEQIGCATRVAWIGMGSLADVALFTWLGPSDLLVGHVFGHVRTVAQLALLVLEVRIVCRIWAIGEVIIITGEIVVWRC